MTSACRALRRQYAAAARSLSEKRNSSILSNLSLPQKEEEAANQLLTLCHQATYLLYRQIEALKRKHEQEGGLTEELYRKRRDFRKY